ncbi:hypothetical protein E1295_06820 [Nonomuraea mesophila]|uniref:Protein-L-isoaspartate O-methyltransferase n=1 Tax=Nonomuraea mesophila TaxID=2530382 RepID=A0A4R5FUV3_9ACTN|nr:hypothetical protein E1295_06820 [Nonomuraea mesophila]
MVGRRLRRHQHRHPARRRSHGPHVGRRRLHVLGLRAEHRGESAPPAGRRAGAPRPGDRHRHRLDACLLSQLVGEHGSVTSVEVDPQVARQAAATVRTVGARPLLLVGDGAAGHRRGALYDRVHVTCGVRDVPHAWIEQCRPGAVIVVPYCPGFGDGHELRLTVTPDGAAHGRFADYADYMMMRSQRDPADRPPRGSEDRRRSTTGIDPRTIAFAPAGADLAIAALTGLTSEGGADRDEDGELYRLWLSDPADPCAWGTVKWRPGSTEYEVYQVGERPLWDDVTAAYFRWVGWGGPGRDRFGMTVTQSGQYVWVDRPERGLP